MSNLEKEEKEPEFDRKKIVGELWNYDKIINFHRDKILEAKADIKKSDKFYKRVEKFKDYNNENVFVIRSFLKSRTEDATNCIKRSERIVLESKSILIGKATLYDMMGKPQSYKDIEDGKLPFDIIFFDFYEPMEMGIPFFDERGSVLGVLIYKHDKNETESNYSYDYDIYYSTKKMIEEVSLGVWNSEIIIGGLRNIIFRQKLDNTNKIEYCPEGELQNMELREYIKKEISLMDYNGNEYKKTTADSVPNSEILTVIPNLCVNLVNYVNSHNVVYNQRWRAVDVVRRDERGKAKKERKLIPFYITEIRDEYVDNKPKEGKRTIDVRYYCRGHYARHRDDYGNAISPPWWISPCIKGPEGAPFKHKRYLLLAEKLEREKEMQRKFMNPEYDKPKNYR